MQGELALAVHFRRAHIPHPHELQRQRKKIEIFPFAQGQNGHFARKKLHEALHVADGNSAPSLYLIKRIHASEERVFGYGVLI